MHKFNKRRLREFVNNARRVAINSEREICGLLIDNGIFIDLVEVVNISKTPGSFQLSSRDASVKIRGAAALGYQVVGTFHSHPYWLAIPGESDIKGAENNSLMLILDCLGKRARLWRIKNRKKVELRFSLL